ncbi:damage repair protein [Bacillus cereus]|nr:damage repair protein [Bacillus cereus]
MMFDYLKYMNRMIFCINNCSFFANCACGIREFDYLKAKLVVVGEVNKKRAITLSSTTVLKNHFRSN